jgi:hypothetical protein
MNDTITSRVLRPNVGGTCRLQWVVRTDCPRAPCDAVAATSDNGSATGGNVCPEHLFAAVGHYFGLTETK